MSIVRRSKTDHRPMMKHSLNITASGGSPLEELRSDRGTQLNPGIYYRATCRGAPTRGSSGAMRSDAHGIMPASACAPVGSPGAGARPGFPLAGRRGARPGASVHASRDANRHRYFREKLESIGRQPWPIPTGMPESIIIVGGAAGTAAAETLRHECYSATPAASLMS
jgi:hypothetical protein